MVRSARLSLVVLVTALASILGAAESAEISALRAKAENGNGLAMYNLGLVYAEGDGVPTNLAEAFVWLSLAAENGATGKALGSVLGNITDAQLAEGRRRLAEYRTEFAARAAAVATQSVVHRPANRTFTLTTIPPGPNLSSTSQPVTTVTESSQPHSVPPTQPLSPGQTPPDELSRVKADLARANHTIEEQNATIARLQEEILRRLPVTSVSNANPVRTSPPDGTPIR